MKPNRNAPCPCGSGAKFKHCCEGKVTLRQSASSEPQQAEANRLIALFNAGRYAEIENQARPLVERYPNFAIGWKLLGASLHMQGKDSLPTLRRTVELFPGDADAHNNLGNALKDCGQFGDAAISYRHALKIKPNLAGAQCNLGMVLRDLGQWAEAADCYARAIEIRPNLIQAYIDLGYIQQYLQLPAEAEKSYLSALEIDPKCITAMSSLGNIYATAGNMAKAEAMFRRILNVDTNNIGARFWIAHLRKTGIDDENLTALVAAADALHTNPDSISVNEAIALHFALGRSFDDLGNHDRAFPHFLEGCRLKRATLEYDAEQMTQRINKIIRIFDHATIERLRGGGNPSSVPIFVLGFPRSGTTLTEQIISSHPDVYGAGELMDISRIAERDVSGLVGFPDNIVAIDQKVLAKWADDYVSALCQHAPTMRHITDKMPNNYLFVGLIHVMLPNAKIIHVNRNPVDTCLSCFTQLFVEDLRHTYDLAELGQSYVDYARLMEHWRNVLPANAFLDVHYENIVSDQEAQARRMIDFCGLEWNDSCIDFHQNKRSINTASIAQVRRPIYNSSVQRWRPYEKYLEPLLSALGDLAPK